MLPTSRNVEIQPFQRSEIRWKPSSNREKVTKKITACRPEAESATQTRKSWNRYFFAIGTWFPPNFGTLKWLNFNISRCRQHLSRTFSLEKLARTVTSFYWQVKPFPKKDFLGSKKSSSVQGKMAPPICKRLNLGEFHIFSKTGNTCKVFPFRNVFLFFKTLNTQVSSPKTGPDCAV